MNLIKNLLHNKLINYNFNSLLTISLFIFFTIIQLSKDFYSNFFFNTISPLTH